MQEKKVRETTKNWIPRNSHYIYLYACNIYSSVVLSLFFTFLFHSWVGLFFFFIIVSTFVRSLCFLSFLLYVTARADFFFSRLFVRLFRLSIFLSPLDVCVPFCIILDSLVRPVQIPAYVRCKIARNLSLSLNKNITQT